MLVKDFQTKINTIRKGSFVKATWRSEKVVNGVKCEKVSNGVVRFVKYANIKGVVVKNTNRNENHINEWLIQASNGNVLVQMATTHIKSKSTYKINGVEVDKQSYENLVGANGGSKVVFRVKLENLLSLGEWQ